MTVATDSDVAVAIGRPISDSQERAQVNYWLEAAELLIRSRLGAVADLDQEAVKYVETEAVVAKMRNPEGYQSESIDDYTYRFGAESRRVVILDEWWALLAPGEGTAIYSTRPGFESDIPDSWLWAAP